MNHPGIHQIGRVDDDGETVVVSGWGLTWCAAHCPCHMHPRTGQLMLADNQATGALGLISYRDCDCCRAWTVDELAAVVRDLAQVQAVETG